MAEADLEALVASARSGNRDALEKLVRAIQPGVYAIALRFLWHPEDAEDATQEILIRVITGLSGFRGESRFQTWVYRVACNALSSSKRGRMERMELSFDALGEDLARGLSDAPLAVAADGPLRGVVRASRSTPEQVRVEVDVEGIGTLDAVAGLDAHPAVGERVGLVVDPTRLARISA